MLTGVVYEETEAKQLSVEISDKIRESVAGNSEYYCIICYFYFNLCNFI